jgi:Protein of unknown function (DUF3738)
MRFTFHSPRSPRARRLVAALILALGAILIPAQRHLLACTGFCAVSKDGAVLVGNNEDWFNPRTKIRFIPAKNGSYGRLYVGFDDLWPQGGMNERGLWFDGFATPAVRPKIDLPSYSGNIVDDAMATCGTVEEVVQLFSRYNRAFLAEAILMFADATGDAVSIEANAIVRKTGRHFVQTNFHQSRTHIAPDARFRTATAMLDRAGDDVSVELFRRILEATHQEGVAPTLYSNIYDLRARKMYLYHFHDYDHVATVDLARELEKGERVIDIPSLFPKNAKAESFMARQPQVTQPFSGPVMTGLLAMSVTLVAAAVYGLFRATRRIRLVAAGAVVIVFAAVAALGVMVGSSERDGRQAWIQFSIGPASGRSVSIGTNSIRANGMSLEHAIATAFEIPSVRVVGPAWLRTTRYSLTAIVDVDEADKLRQMLKQELEARLHLVTHFEPRPFDVFVLRATAAPRLDAGAAGPQIHVRDDGMQACSSGR